jgi:hypothetical protein
LAEARDEYQAALSVHFLMPNYEITRCKILRPSTNAFPVPHLRGQPLDISHGDQEEIQRPSTVVALSQMAMANEPVIDPTKAGRDLMLPIRPEQMFANHKPMAFPWAC